MKNDKLEKAIEKRIKVQGTPKKLSIDLYLNEEDLPPIPVLAGNEEN